MGAFARAFLLMLVAYAVIGGVLLAKTGGPATPSESIAGTAHGPTTNATTPHANASALGATNVTGTPDGSAAATPAENATSGT